MKVNAYPAASLLLLRLKNVVGSVRGVRFLEKCKPNRDALRRPRHRIIPTPDNPPIIQIDLELNRELVRNSSARIENVPIRKLAGDGPALTGRGENRNIAAANKGGRKQIVGQPRDFPGNSFSGPRLDVLIHRVQSFIRSLALLTLRGHRDPPSLVISRRDSASRPGNVSTISGFVWFSF